MKLQNLDKKRLEKFFEVVDKCESDVKLIVKDQMEMNLKSKLSQYVTLVGLFSRAEVPEIQIECSSKNDVFRMIDYLVEDGGTF